MFFSLLRESGGKSGCFLAECFRKVFGSLARMIGKGCVGGITNPHCTRRRIEPCRGSICDRHCPGLGEGLGDLTGEFGATAVRCVKISCAWGGTGMASSAGRGGGGDAPPPIFPSFLSLSPRVSPSFHPSSHSVACTASTSPAAGGFQAGKHAI